MITNKSVFLLILLVFFCGKCSSTPSENVKFITKLEQKGSEDWESDILEPYVLENKKTKPTRPEVGDNIEYDQDVENEKILSANEAKQITEINYEKNLNIGLYKKRIVRQANNGYSSIYPTLTPQNPYAPVYPAPDRPTAGIHNGNLPNNYTSNQNSYNSAYSQPYHNNTVSNPVSFRPPYNPQAQNPFLKNTSYSNPGYYNQGSIYNNQSYTNGLNSNSVPYPQYNQNSNQRYNSSLGQPNHYYNPQGNNVNQNKFIPTPANQWTPGYANNSRYNPSGGLTSNGAYSQYPYFNNNSYTTPRTVINGQPNPLNPPYQGFPHYSSTNSQHNFNRSNQWSSSSSSQSPYNHTGNNYPAYIPTDARSSNYSRQNYPSNNPNSYPTQRPYSPNPSPNPYSQYRPVGPNANQNNQYNKEPEHFFFAPGNRDARYSYDPRNNTSPNFSYSQ